MKQVGIVTLISVAASAAAPVSTAARDSVSFETSKTVAQFGGCFVDAQDRASSAWSFVPKGDGGTFSNFGAKGASAPYFLAISDRGTVRQLRLETASAGSKLDRNIANAVGRCV
jgi:hypothetical protein